MIKKYIYLVDEFNRFVTISEYTEDTINYYTSEKGYQHGDFEESKVQNINFGYDGIVDGVIKYIGLTEEEEKYQESSNTIGRIQLLKQMLQETDWKVIVNSELIQAGLEPKYKDLHSERQAWRDEINQLEQQINSLENN